MVEPARQRFDFRDYLELEEMCARTGPKHEFLGGHVWAMARGTPAHARIAINVATLLSAALAGRRCSVHSSDLRIRVRATGLATYPDVSVICDRLELDPEDPKGHTVTNPRLLVEVLSPSTDDYDRGEKLDHYRQIESLEEVVLVHHASRNLEIWRRSGETWTMSETTRGVVQLAIGCALSIDDVYRDPLA